MQAQQVESIKVHESHYVKADGWSNCPLPGFIGSEYERTHCADCGLSIDDENIEQRCIEEPFYAD